MRERVIQGVLYQERVLPGAWKYSGWRANGHHEVSTSPATEWVELGAVDPTMGGMPPGSFVLDSQERAAAAAREVQDAEERRLRYQKGNAKRARTRCRRLIKAAAFDEMLTLTYRANQGCIIIFKTHFREWCRRMKSALGGRFDYCAGYELQQRGAWHAHVACHKLPRHVDYKGVRVDAWKLGTQVWRSIVGEAGGLCFVGGKTRHGAPARRRFSCAQMAAYVSAYITKHYEDVPAEHKRYSRSQSLPEGERYAFTITGMKPQFEGSSCTFGEAIVLGFEVPEGSRIVSWRVNDSDQERRRCWLVTEPIGVAPYGQKQA